MKSSANTRPITLDVNQWREVFAQVDGLLEAQTDTSPDASSEVPLDAHADADSSPMSQSSPPSQSPQNAVDSVVRRWRDATHLRASTLTQLQDDALAGLSASATALTQPKTDLVLGRYRLLERIGQGGMGSVWRAERTDGLYDGEVAIKLLGSLALSAHARARFAQEGQILARLKHPNIAGLLDAGITDDGQRYLVIELIDGIAINDYVEKQSLNLNQRLQLFRQLLDAVAFAHESLVIHRDIKPANILVTANGTVKLLDFGVAKLLVEGEDAALTQVHGSAYTEAYASPEQISGDAPTVVADVFSLSMILLELLSGKRATWANPKRKAKSGDHPEQLIEISPLDLRAIVRKALEVAPEDRYRSIAALDDDVRRFLSNEPVLAQPPTRFYQLQKFFARNKILVLAGFAASLAVLASLAFAVWQLHEARSQRALAVTEANRANQVTEFLKGLFQASDPRLPSTQDKRTLTAMQLLDSGRARLETQLDDQPETKLSLLGLFAEIYGYLGDGEKFEAINNERIRLATERFGPLHPAALNGRMTDAEADLYSGNLSEARVTLQALDEPFRKTFGEKSERYADLLGTLAEIERRAATENAEQVLARFNRALAVFDAFGSDSGAYAVTLQNYATALYENKRFQQASKIGARAIGLMEKRKDVQQSELAIAYGRRAETLEKLDRNHLVEAEYDKALGIFSGTYGTNSTLYLNAVLEKAQWLHRRMRRAEAWTLVDGVFATERLPSADTYGVPEQYYVRGVLLLAESRSSEVVPMLETAVDAWRNANNNPRRLNQAQAQLEKARAAVSAAKAMGARVTPLTPPPKTIAPSPNRDGS